MTRRHRRIWRVSPGRADHGAAAEEPEDSQGDQRHRPSRAGAGPSARYQRAADVLNDILRFVTRPFVRCGEPAPLALRRRMTTCRRSSRASRHGNATGPVSAGIAASLFRREPRSARSAEKLNRFQVPSSRFQVPGSTRNLEHRTAKLNQNPEHEPEPGTRNVERVYNAVVQILLLSMPDSFEHTPTLAVRMPNGALASLAGNVDAHHKVAIADLILAQSSVQPTVTRLMRELQPKLVGLSVMTFQRGTARRIISLVKSINPDAKVVVGGYDPSLAPDAWTHPALAWTSSSAAKATSRSASCARARTQAAAEWRRRTLVPDGRRHAAQSAAIGDDAGAR